MIEHLRGRERALEPLGWTGQEAEWIALVYLHGGVFTRAQFCFHFDSRRHRATRFVQALKDRRAAVEWSDPLSFNGRSRICLISGKPIYRALGAEIIRHRRWGSPHAAMRRLLSLDYVLEHPGMGWLPTEVEKVEFFEELGVDRRLIPRRIYYGAVGARRRYFALKLPVAVDARTVTFVYVDPGHRTDSELRSFGSAHGRLWDTLREKGRQVRVIGVGAGQESIERAERVLRRWAATAPGKPSRGRTVKQEIKEIDDAMHHDDDEFLAQYGGFGGALQRSAALQRLPEAQLPEGVSINDYATWRATRFAEPEEARRWSQWGSG